VPGDYAAIGHALASLHQVRGESFGLAEFDGFFGPLPQPNQPVSSGTWADFYAERRMLPMLRLAVDSRYLPAELARGVEQVAARLPALCGPDPVPTLLHGDAQQNNFVSTADGAVAIDVAPYFGHPEADLALVDNYSPVDPALFRTYAESGPIDPGFAQRRELWRLHSYLAAIAFHGADAIDSFLPASTPQYAYTHSRTGTAREQGPRSVAGQLADQCPMTRRRTQCREQCRERNRRCPVGSASQ
jgi:fructosamine-3-kinase